MEVDRHAKMIWDYMLMHQPVEKADVMLVLCSYNLIVAEYAAQLYTQGIAPIILFSGSEGSLTAGRYEGTEAERLAKVAVKEGVPASAILIESKATNTGENIKFSAALLREEGIEASSVLLVQKPYMERRSLATAQAQWPQPQPELRVTSPQVSYDEYMKTTSDKDDSIKRMVADLQRLVDYAPKGWSTPQEIPDKVLRAKDYLIDLGYNL